jgi:hypothetical protein
VERLAQIKPAHSAIKLSGAWRQLDIECSSGASAHGPQTTGNVRSTGPLKDPCRDSAFPASRSCSPAQGGTRPGAAVIDCRIEL